MSDIKTAFHGFVSLFDFLKASLSLGTLVGGMVWAVLVFALDGKYAAKSVEDTVKQNTVILTDVQTQIGEIRIKLLQSELVETKARSCNATSPEAKEHFAEQLQSIVASYQKITHETPFVPRCEDLR